MAGLQERLVAHGRLGSEVSVLNRVMNRVHERQSPSRPALATFASLWRWGLGVGAAAAAVVAAALFLNSPGGQAVAAEVMAKGVRAVERLTSVHLQCRVRTAPAENFAHLDPRQDFVTLELWKEFGPPNRWRVEKPGRVAVMDGHSTLLFLRPFNSALKIPQASQAAFDTGWLHALADIEGTLSQELTLARTEGWTMQLAREKDASGTPKAVVIIEAKSNLPDGDYLKNAFFNTADTRRVYRFDELTGRLESLQIYLHEPAGDALVLEVDRIEYNPDLTQGLFELALPDNVKWLNQPEARPADSKYISLAADQVARVFFEACGREDWEVVGDFWPLPIDDRFRSFLGGLKVLRIGEPFVSAASLAKFVPYEVELRNGTVKKHNLALKQHRQTGRWFVDGGL